MNKIFHHIGLFSRDPKKLIEFYAERLGFETVGTKSISKEWIMQIFNVPSECQLTKLRSGSLILEIFSSPELELESRKTPTAGYNHWGLGVEDKEGFVQELEGKGVPVLRLEGTERFIYFIKDSEGNLIEIYQG
jgi:catechol 2,3-dioxygenase-like lactoylglutathione lyase family enzyme